MIRFPIHLPSAFMGRIVGFLIKLIVGLKYWLESGGVKLSQGMQRVISKDKNTLRYDNLVKRHKILQKKLETEKVGRLLLKEEIKPLVEEWQALTSKRNMI